VAGYLLEKLVGVGGMAAVFRARDERLGRVVALKLLAGDEVVRKRFVREARAVAAVDHPHIIPVYEAGEAAGVLFIAMRFVAGDDLRVVVSRDGALRPRRAAAFISPVASALDAAHDAGLVHRDVKPANMLVDVGPHRPEHVYLSDFGVARGVMSSSGLTRAGQFLGTPDYAAPEQISGRDVDGRADEYALACVAYTLLSGSVLFRRDVPMAVLYAHLSVPPPRLTAVRPELPDAVNEVLARALAKQPDDRYDSCGTFADELRDALGLEPYVPARRSAGGEDPRGRLRRAIGLAERGDRTADHPAGLAPDQAAARIAIVPVDDEHALAASGLAVPAGRRGDLDRGGGRGPRLLRQRAGGQRHRRRVDHVPRLRARTPVPAFRSRGPHRAAQCVPPHRAGDRPDRPAHRSRGLAAARRADRRPGRELVGRRRRLAERHRGQRQGRPGGPGRAVATRRPHPSGRLDRDHHRPRLTAVTG